MPKLDLTTARRIRGAFGEALAIKGAGFSWETSGPLYPYVDSGTIPLHISTRGANANPATMIANKGAAGAAHDATISGVSLPLSGPWIDADPAVGFPMLANQFSMIGFRIMWVAQPLSDVGTYRFFGRSGGTSNNSYIRVINGVSLQAWADSTGSGVAASSGAFATSVNPRLFEIEMTPANVSFFVNSLPVGVVATPWPLFNFSRITQGNSALQSFAGSMGDVLTVRTGQPDTSAAIADSRAFLNDRFSLGL